VLHHLTFVGYLSFTLQGTASAEVQAISQAGPAARGCTAYLNLETGDSHGDTSSVTALVNSGVSRIVVGLLHPLAHLRGQAVRTLKEAGISVNVLQPGSSAQSQAAQQCLQACLQVNEVSLLSTRGRTSHSCGLPLAMSESPAQEIICSQFAFRLTGGVVRELECGMG